MAEMKQDTKTSAIGKVAVANEAPATTLLVHDDKVVIPFEVAPGISQDREVNIEKFFANISSQAMIDTGLIPVTDTGLLSLRQLGKYRQITFQLGPGKSYVTWGSSESQSEKPTFFVASPYRIVIADIFDGDLLGARMFYSTEAISDPTQQLCHINLPNVNCRGYGQGNGVGWLCLYLRSSWKDLDISSQIHAIVERAGGGEAYNDGNMSNTDGARFYQEFKKDNLFIYNPAQWQKKSEEEGWEWVLNPDLWIPVMVGGPDKQEKHYHGAKAVPLTVDMAMRGQYKAYYTDVAPLKPINAVSRPDKKTEDSKSEGVSFSFRNAIERSVIMDQPYGAPFVQRKVLNADDDFSVGAWAAGTIKKRSKQVSEASEKIDFKPKAIGTCKVSSKPIYEGMDFKEIPNYGKVLADHFKEEDFVKSKEDKFIHKDQAVWIPSEDAFFHKSTPHNSCHNCGEIHVLKMGENVFYALDGDPYARCKICAETRVCAVTGLSKLVEELKKVEALNPLTGKIEEYYIGEENFSHMTKCLCNLLVPHENTNVMPGQGNVCAQCVKHTNEGPVYECGIHIVTPSEQEATETVS
jgi:hypothetical protein